MLLGNKIKELRDEQGVLQRQLAAYLEIDTPMFSKIERENCCPIFFSRFQQKPFTKYKQQSHALFDI